MPLPKTDPTSNISNRNRKRLTAGRSERILRHRRLDGRVPRRSIVVRSLGVGEALLADAVAWVQGTMVLRGSGGGPHVVTPNGVVGNDAALVGVRRRRLCKAKIVRRVAGEPSTGLAFGTGIKANPPKVPGGLTH